MIYIVSPPSYLINNLKFIFMETIEKGNNNDISTEYNPYPGKKHGFMYYILLFAAFAGVLVLISVILEKVIG